LWAVVERRRNQQPFNVDALNSQTFVLSDRMHRNARFHSGSLTELWLAAMTTPMLLQPAAAEVFVLTTPFIER
jgi:hypothetical protein